jgi:nucleotide-binding universal stress UspA family protein
MYKTVLLVADLQRDGPYSTHTLAVRDVAAALVRDPSRHLHVLSVYAYDRIDTRRLPLMLVGPYHDEQLSRTDMHMERSMDNYIAGLVAEGIEVSTLLRVGKPRALIVQVATDIKADLLIMGAIGGGGRRGRVPSRVLRQISAAVPCPVLLVWPQYSLDLGPERVEEWPNRRAYPGPTELNQSA